MSSKQEKIIIGIVILIVFIPAMLFLSAFLTYGSIHRSHVYTYEPATPSATQKVVLHTDLGHVKIRYNQTPTPFYAKIRLDARIQTSYRNRMTFNDFFGPVDWENRSSTGVNFRVPSKRLLRINPLHWFTQSNLGLTVTLRTDVIYSIVGSTYVGTLDLKVPRDVPTDQVTLNTTTGTATIDASPGSVFNGSVNVKTTTGSATMRADEALFTQDITAIGTTGKVLLNFTECVIGGDLTGLMTTGSMEVGISDCAYADTSFWDFTASTGSLTVDISQSVSMGGNVIGDITVTTGTITVTYRDTQNTVGAAFFGSTNVGRIDFVNSGGFKKEGFRFISEDYSSAEYSYDFDLSTTTGDILVNGGSNVS